MNRAYPVITHNIRRTPLEGRFLGKRLQQRPARDR